MGGDIQQCWRDCVARAMVLEGGFNQPSLQPIGKIRGIILPTASHTCKVFVIPGDATNKITTLVDATGNARDLTAFSAGRECMKASALLSTKTPVPSVIQTLSSMNSTLGDATGKRCVPLTGDYTKMFIILTRNAADFTTGNKAYFSSWKDPVGGHFILPISPAGTIATSENGVTPPRAILSVTMIPNKWYCLFVTFTSANKMAGWYCNGVKAGTDVAYSASTEDHWAADPPTCISGVASAGVLGWTANTDWLECAVWNSALTAPMVAEETTRLATLYGITLN
jgi:hypothetical protein